MSALAPDPAVTPAAPSDADEQLLAQLGYRQELRRKLSGFSNFAVSFSIISILAGAITSYYIAMGAGGPLSITLGWLFVGGLYWILSAKNWFTGPRHTIDEPPTAAARTAG
jgi:hypothetical protein